MSWTDAVHAECIHHTCGRCSYSVKEPSMERPRRGNESSSAVVAFVCCFNTQRVRRMKQLAHTAYSAAKFAVKGFSEALINDLRLNAPHVKVSVVMPGHIGTSIGINSRLIQGGKKADEMSDDELEGVRQQIVEQPGAGDMSLEQVREAIAMQGVDFRDNAPTTAAEAARMILDGVKAEKWRILLGKDAHLLDDIVRAHPEEAYEDSFMVRIREALGPNATLPP